MSSGSAPGPRRVRRAAPVVFVLAGWLGLASPAPAQSGAPEVRFTPTAGTFVERETVALSVEAKADIHYTLDGSLPTATSPVYRAPLTIDTSTRIRAVAIVAGGAPGENKQGAARSASGQGPVTSELYLRVDPDTQGFTSHLPVILIHTFETGTPDGFGTAHVPASLLVLEPTAGATRIVGRATLDARIGIHVRGQSSRRFPKKQYAVELRADDSDADRARALLGLPGHADWVLSDPIAYDRSLIRNAVAYALSNRIGRYAPRTRFAEVFMVDDAGDVRAGSYLGLFTLIEKIERGPERVNVSRLAESDAGPLANSGGFILRIDKGAPDFDAGGRWLQFVYPPPEDMLRAERKPQLDFIRSFIEGFRQALFAGDFRDPVTSRHYSQFIDVDAWIDHHILNALIKNVDGLRFSAYFHKERDGRLAAGPIWDLDRSMGTLQDPRAVDPAEWKLVWSDATDYFNEGWWRLLFRDPDFTSRYRSRFKALLDTDFSADSLDRVIDGMALTVGDAAQRNFRRWPQFPPLDNSHAAEVALMKDFLRRRVAWLKMQLDSAF